MSDEESDYSILSGSEASGSVTGDGYSSGSRSSYGSDSSSLPDSEPPNFDDDDDLPPDSPAPTMPPPALTRKRRSTTSSGRSHSRRFSRDDTSGDSRRLQKQRSSSAVAGSPSAARARSPSHDSVPRAASCAERIEEVEVPVVKVPKREWTEEDAALRIQSVWRGHLVRNVNRKKLKMNWRRNLIAGEILSTERSYLDSLTRLSSIFLIPLQAHLPGSGQGRSRSTSFSSPVNPRGVARRKQSTAGTPSEEPTVQEGDFVLVQEDFNSIFSNVQILLNFNKTFLKEVEERWANWTPRQKIGDVFVKMAPFLKLYAQYMANYNAAVETVTRLKKTNSGFNKFIQASEQLPECSGLNLFGFLIQPVQRIPRYNMLLKDLLKHTWEDHPDYGAIQSSVNTMQGVATSMNESVRLSENLHKIFEIQHSLVGEFQNLITPTRRYIRDGRTPEEADPKAAMFLFNDLLLITRTQDDGQSFTVLKELSPSLLSIRDIDETGLEVHFPDYRLMKFTFANSSLRDQWLHDLGDVIHNHVATAVHTLQNHRSTEYDGNDLTEGATREVQEAAEIMRSRTVETQSMVLSEISILCADRPIYIPAFSKFLPRVIELLGSLDDEVVELAIHTLTAMIDFSEKTADLLVEKEANGRGLTANAESGWKGLRHFLDVDPHSRLECLRLFLRLARLNDDLRVQIVQNDMLGLIIQALDPATDKLIERQRKKEEFERLAAVIAEEEELETSDAPPPPPPPPDAPEAPPAPDAPAAPPAPEMADHAVVPPPPPPPMEMQKTEPVLLATQIIAHLAGNAYIRTQVFKFGALEPLISIFSDIEFSTVIKIHACHALQKLANNDASRRSVRQSKVLGSLISALVDRNMELRMHVATLVRNLSMRDEDGALISAGLIPKVVQMLHTSKNHPQHVELAVRTLSNVGTSQQAVVTISEQGGLAAVVQHMQMEDEGAQAAVVQFLATAVKQAPALCDTLISMKTFVPGLSSFLRSASDYLVEHGMRVAVAVSTAHERLPKLIPTAPAMMSRLAKCATTTADMDIAKLILRALCNITQVPGARGVIAQNDNGVLIISNFLGQMRRDANAENSLVLRTYAAQILANLAQDTLNDIGLRSKGLQGLVEGLTIGKEMLSTGGGGSSSASTMANTPRGSEVDDSSMSGEERFITEDVLDALHEADEPSPQPVLLPNFCCLALWRLSGRHEAVRMDIVTHMALRPLVELMGNYGVPQLRLVSRLAVRTISNLMAHPAVALHYSLTPSFVGALRGALHSQDPVHVEHAARIMIGLCDNALGDKQIQNCEALEDFYPVLIMSLSEAAEGDVCFEVLLKALAHLTVLPGVAAQLKSSDWMERAMVAIGGPKKNPKNPNVQDAYLTLLTNFVRVAANAKDEAKMRLAKDKAEQKLVELFSKLFDVCAECLDVMHIPTRMEAARMLAIFLDSIPDTVGKKAVDSCLESLYVSLDLDLICPMEVPKLDFPMFLPGPDDEIVEESEDASEQKVESEVADEVESVATEEEAAPPPPPPPPPQKVNGLPGPPVRPPRPMTPELRTALALQSWATHAISKLAVVNIYRVAERGVQALVPMMGEPHIPLHTQLDIVTILKSICVDADGTSLLREQGAIVGLQRLLSHFARLMSDASSASSGEGESIEAKLISSLHRLTFFTLDLYTSGDDRKNDLMLGRYFDPFTALLRANGLEQTIISKTLGFLHKMILNSEERRCGFMTKGLAAATLSLLDVNNPAKEATTDAGLKVLMEAVKSRPAANVLVKVGGEKIVAPFLHAKNPAHVQRALSVLADVAVIDEVKEILVQMDVGRTAVELLGSRFQYLREGAARFLNHLSRKTSGKTQNPETDSKTALFMTEIAVQPMLQYLRGPHHIPQIRLKIELANGLVNLCKPNDDPTCQKLLKMKVIPDIVSCVAAPEPIQVDVAGGSKATALFTLSSNMQKLLDGVGEDLMSIDSERAVKTSPSSLDFASMATATADVVNELFAKVQIRSANALELVAAGTRGLKAMAGHRGCAAIVHKSSGVGVLLRVLPHAQALKDFDLVESVLLGARALISADPSVLDHDQVLMACSEFRPQVPTAAVFAFSSLVSLMDDPPNREIRDAAAKVMAQLASASFLLRLIGWVGGVRAICSLLVHEDALEECEEGMALADAAVQATCLFSGDPRLCDIIVESGGVEGLLGLIGLHSADIDVPGVHALRNLVAHSADVAERVCASGGVKKCVSLLSGRVQTAATNPVVAERFQGAVDLLYTVASHERTLPALQEAMRPIVGLLSSPKQFLKMKSTAMQTLTLMCGSELVRAQLHTTMATTVARLVTLTAEPDLAEDASSFLAALCLDEAGCEAVVEAEGISGLCMTLGSKAVSQTTQSMVLKCLALIFDTPVGRRRVLEAVKAQEAIAAGKDDFMTLSMAKGADVFQVALPFVSSTSRGLRKSAVHVLCNLALINYNDKCLLAETPKAMAVIAGLFHDEEVDLLELAFRTVHRVLHMSSAAASLVHRKILRKEKIIHVCAGSLGSSRPGLREAAMLAMSVLVPGDGKVAMALLGDKIKDLVMMVAIAPGRPLPPLSSSDSAPLSMGADSTRSGAMNALSDEMRIRLADSAVFLLEALSAEVDKTRKMINDTGVDDALVGHIACCRGVVANAATNIVRRVLALDSHESSCRSKQPSLFALLGSTHKSVQHSAIFGLATQDHLEPADATYLSKANERDLRPWISTLGDVIENPGKADLGKSTCRTIASAPFLRWSLTKVEPLRKVHQVVVDEDLLGAPKEEAWVRQARRLRRDLPIDVESSDLLATWLRVAAMRCLHVVCVSCPRVVTLLPTRHPIKQLIQALKVDDPRIVSRNAALTLLSLCEQDEGVRKFILLMYPKSKARLHGDELPTCPQRKLNEVYQEYHSSEKVGPDVPGLPTAQDDVARRDQEARRKQEQEADTAYQDEMRRRERDRRAKEKELDHARRRKRDEERRKLEKESELKRQQYEEERRLIEAEERKKEELEEAERLAREGAERKVREELEEKERLEREVKRVAEEKAEAEAREKTLREEEERERLEKEAEDRRLAAEREKEEKERRERAERDRERLRKEAAALEGADEQQTPAHVAVDKSRNETKVGADEQEAPASVPEGKSPKEAKVEEEKAVGRRRHHHRHRDRDGEQVRKERHSQHERTPEEQAERERRHMERRAHRESTRGNVRGEESENRKSRAHASHKRVEDVREEEGAQPLRVGSSGSSSESVGHRHHRHRNRAKEEGERREGGERRRDRSERPREKGDRRHDAGERSESAPDEQKERQGTEEKEKEDRSVASESTGVPEQSNVPPESPPSIKAGSEEKASRKEEKEKSSRREKDRAHRHRSSKSSGGSKAEDSRVEIYSGYMYKLGQKDGQWKKRFFVLTSRKELDSFVNEEKRQHRGTISLAKASRARISRHPPESAPSAHCFALVGPVGTLGFLCLDSDSELRGWLDALNDILAKDAVKSEAPLRPAPAMSSITEEDEGDG